MELRDRRIVVTGGAGFIGSHVVDKLIAASNEVVVIDDLSTGSLENLAAARAAGTVCFEEADIRDAAAMAELIRGADLVLHMAVACVRTSLNDPEFVHDVNASGTLNVCLAAQRNGIERLVYVSSSEAYGSAQYVPMDEGHPMDPTTVYGASKLVGEVYALAMQRTYGTDVTVIRPFNSYGPREPHEGKRAEVIPKFVLRTLAGDRPVIFGDGSQTRDFTWVEDTAEGIIAAAASDKLVGERVNLARGQEVSIASLARKVLDVLGHPELDPVFDDPRPGDVDRLFADTTKANALIGWEPSCSIDEGLGRYVEWLSGQGVDPSDWLRRETTRNW